MDLYSIPSEFEAIKVWNFEKYLKVWLSYMKQNSGTRINKPRWAVEFGSQNVVEERGHSFASEGETSCEKILHAIKK